MKVFRFARTQYPISYRTIPDSIFELTEPDTVWGRLDTHENQTTLWVDVVVRRGYPTATPLPGAPRVLLSSQRRQLEDRLRDFAVDDLSRRGLFEQVRGLDRQAPDGSPPPRQFLLTLIFEGSDSEFCRARLLYQARLVIAPASELIMQDGPRDPCYSARPDRDCSAYEMVAVSIDNSTAYLDRRLLKARLQGTSDKVAQSVRAHAVGAEPLAMKECCFCE